MFPLMLFMFLFFLGFLAMFLYLLKMQEKYARSLSDEHAQLRVLMRAMESRLDNMAQEGVSGMASQNRRPAALPDSDKAEIRQAGTDPLLHLSFEEPRQMSGAMPVNRELELNLDPSFPAQSMPDEKQ